MDASILPCTLYPSSLKRYQECPQRFLWQDVEDRSADGAPSVEQLIGIAVHKALETFFRHEPSRRTSDVLDALLTRSWQRALASKPLAASADVAYGLSQARELIQTFLTSFDLTARPLRIEQELGMRLNNGTHVKARIDRIDPWREGSVRLIDYKTGRHQLDRQDVARDTAAIVHLLTAESAGFQVERLSLLYLRTGEEIYWEPERDDIEFAAERLRRVLRDLRDDRDFSPMPNPFCLSCPFQSSCDAFAAQLGASSRPLPDRGLGIANCPAPLSLGLSLISRSGAGPSGKV